MVQLVGSGLTVNSLPNQDLCVRSFVRLFAYCFVVGLYARLFLSLFLGLVGLFCGEVKWFAAWILLLLLLTNKQLLLLTNKETNKERNKQTNQQPCCLFGWLIGLWAC